MCFYCMIYGDFYFRSNSVRSSSSYLSHPNRGWSFQRRRRVSFNLTFEVSIINGERHACLKLLPYYGKTYSDIPDSKLIYLIVSLL